MCISDVGAAIILVVPIFASGIFREVTRLIIATKAIGKVRRKDVPAALKALDYTRKPKG